MTIFIVNGQEKELRYNVNGIDISGDMIGNASHGMDQNEDGHYIASQEDFEWWQAYFNGQEAMESAIASYKESFDANEVDQIVQDWIGVDLEDQASQVIMGLQQHFGKSNLIDEVRRLIQYPEVEGETTLEDWINEGDTGGMTAEEIAAEWDALSAQAE